MKYFLYIRKSTDEDDRQVLSLEAQEAELREFAQKERLNIVSVFRESQTAKDPGRPVFNEMLLKIENGEADGIISWHPDRLARNSVDGGKIIFLLDSEKIKFLKFPTFWFESTPQGKFMLNIAFGQSKYFVDNLSENVKRGLRQKLRRGEWPACAPLGYLNDLRNHTIIPDPDKFKLVRKVFELYATGDYSLKDIRNKMVSIGLFTRKGNPLALATIQRLLKNSFYYGLFKYNGEMHQGKHKPMIAKKLFEKCQNVMAYRGRPQKRKVREFAFRGLFFCGECGCSFTSEVQKGHNYYRCTKKREKCGQKYIREEILDKQISDIIQKVSLPESWYDEMILELEKDSEQEYQDSVVFVQNLKSDIEKCENKLDKLLDEKLDGTIDKEEYIAKKNKILNKKLDFEEKLKDFERKGSHWLEPAKNFILEVKQAKNIASQENLSVKRDFLKKIGSNRILRDKRVGLNVNLPWQIAYETPSVARARGEGGAERTVMLGGRDSNSRPIGYTLSPVFTEVWTISSPSSTFPNNIGKNCPKDRTLGCEALPVLTISKKSTPVQSPILKQGLGGIVSEPFLIDTRTWLQVPLAFLALGFLILRESYRGNFHFLNETIHSVFIQAFLHGAAKSQPTALPLSYHRI